MSSLDIIMVIVIIAIVCFGSIFAHCAWINEADVDISCKLWAEQWDDLDKRLKYSKLGLIYPPNNDAVIVKADRILQDDVIKFIKEENLKQLNEEKARVLDNMMCSSKQFEVALEQMRDCTAESIMSPNEMRKMLGLDELMDEEEEPKSKKLEPLICKMCGGTVAKKGDIYECEYCGLHYELR